MSIAQLSPFQGVKHNDTAQDIRDACTRRDVWTEPETARAMFHIEADADSESLPRILNLFSLQLLLPDAFSARRDADTLYVHIEQAAISEHRAEVIAQKLRSLFCVQAVDLNVIC